MSALVSMMGPLCLGPLAHKLSGYKQTLVLTLFLSFFAATSLLFIPRVISSEHTPKMYFDCSEGVFRIEQCPDWEGQCHTYPQRPATNFSSFELVTCSYVCNDEKTPVNTSWYPVNVCFHNSNDPASLCLGEHSLRVPFESILIQKYSFSDVQKERVIPTDTSVSLENSIQFDSRFDRWPAIDTENDEIVDRMFDGLRTCTFKPAPPILMSQKVFSSIQCRPFVPSCSIYCSVNLRHRTSGPVSGQTRVRPPTPCQMVQGNRNQTFYLYLLFRCLTDLTLLTAHTLIEAIRIAKTNNYDAFYAGSERFWTMILPFIMWPPVCGVLSDYFLTKDAPIYAPPIVIFDGFIAITIFLVIMLPVDNTQNKEMSSSRQKIVLQPTKFRYPRSHSDQYLLYRLVLLIPLVLVLGSFWGLTDSLIRPFYRRSLRSSNCLIGFATIATFIVSALFAFMAKSVIFGIGRMHLILLAFIFYSLRCSGISFLIGSYSTKTLLLLPFEMMSAFCLPLPWIGITAYGQHLIKRSPNGLSYATGTTIFQTYSPHVIMQYTLNLVHFGGGRALGAAFGSIWLGMWSDIYTYWLWLTDLDQDAIDSYALESILSEDSALRVLLRLVSIVSLLFGLLFVCLYHSCCLNCIIPRHDLNKSTHRRASKDKNSQSYLKLRCKSENEVYPLKSKHEKSSTKLTPESVTRSMVTLRDGNNAESMVDDDDQRDLYLL